MILPIYAYGQPVLKKIAQEIEQDYEALDVLIADMYETMYNASGVGLAAPQIGRSIRLFVIDTIQMMDDDKKSEGIRSAFINPIMLDEYDKAWSYEEGCLSIPDITGEVERKSKIRIKYFDENWAQQERIIDGLNARVIQHEYDHVEGKLFTEKLGPIKKRRIKKKLDLIKKGEFESKYRMKFVRPK